MRYIGLDLALTTAHKAIVMDARGPALTPVLKVSTSATDLDGLFARAREGAAEEPLTVVMEPTGMIWFPVAVFCRRRGVTVYVVNSQQVADLRRYFKKHAKSDRIDARVLAKLPVVSPEKLHPLPLGSAQALACQCGGKELDRLMTQRIAIHNRWLAMDRFAWPGVESVFGEALSPLARWFREGWYDPQRVIAAEAPALRRAWEEACLEDTGGAEREDWAEAVVAIAQQVLALYGAEAQFLDYAYLQAEVTREQALLSTLEARHHRLQLKTVCPL